VTRRFIGMTDGNIPRGILKVVPGAGQQRAEIAISRLISKGEDIALVIFDTKASYFDGDNEDDNMQAKAHALWFRSISMRLPGSPVVLILCHPPKAAQSMETMRPRGGGGFLNEIDGNLPCISHGDLTVVSRDPEKYRGVAFSPLMFLREVRFPERLRDTETGKPMPAVICHLADDREVAEQEFQMETEDTQVLQVLAEDSTLSTRHIAKRLLWLLKNGEPDHKKVRRVLGRLRNGKMINDTNSHLTVLGQETLEEYIKSTGKKGNGADHNNVVHVPLFEARRRFEEKTDG
jgi:hypothetical protein